MYVNYSAALAAFLRGFAGLERLGPNPDAARRALAGRAEGRRSCC